MKKEQKKECLNNKDREQKKFDFLRGWKELNTAPPVVRDEGEGKGKKQQEHRTYHDESQEPQLVFHIRHKNSIQDAESAIDQQSQNVGYADLAKG